LAKWQVDGVEPIEVARRLIDLFVVSVLVDGEFFDVAPYFDAAD
jgi:hypothetical protein